MADPAVDLSQLTEEQQLALQQFTSVTDQDLSAAVPLLEKCQWNAQIAITRFFDGDADTIDPAAEAARAPPPPSQNARHAETLMDNIPSRSSSSSASSSSRAAARRNGLEPAPRVVPTPENQLTQPIPFPFSIIFLPFNLLSIVFSRVLGTVGYFFPFIPRLLQRFFSTGRASAPSRSDGSGRRPLSPRDTAERFIREFEEEYGVTHGTLPFYEGGYAQAFDTAKRDLKFLFIVLLSPEHDDTGPFVRETLLSPEVVQFVKNPENNVILWGGSVQDAEAYQVSSALHVTRFPFVCVIVHTPAVSSTSMSKIVSVAGPVAAGELIAKVQGAMQAQREELERARRAKAERDATRSLRQEQESAYERSLAQDREKARKRKEEEAEREKVDREIRLREERKAELARLRLQWKRWRASSIPSEPGSDVADAVRISLRLPSGERVIRRFRAEAELEELYAFVECQDVLKAKEEGGTMSEKEILEPQGYEHEYRFVLVSPMPREVYGLEKGGSIRDRIGRSGNLIVEKIIGEDDEEEDEEGEDQE